MEAKTAVGLTELERLQRQLRLVSEFQEELQTGSWEWRPGDTYVFWSDTMFSLLNLSIYRENLIAHEEIEQFIDEQDREIWLQKRRELEQSGYVEYYIHVNTADRLVKRVHVREKKVLLGTEVIYQGTWQNEAGLRELHRPLADQNKELARQLSVFDRADQVSDTGTWQVNLQTFETFYSDNVYRIYGLAPQSVPAHVDVFRKYIHPEDKAVVIRAQEKAYIEMLPVHLQYRIVLQDGEVRHITQASHLLKNEKGEHILAGSIKDITEQKLLEIQIEETSDLLNLQNELFLDIEKLSRAGSWRINLQTRKAVYSANLYRIFGLKPFSVPPGIEHFIHFVHPDQREALRNVYEKLFAEKVLPDFTFNITRADGKTRTLVKKSRFVKDVSGQEIVIGTVQDVTHQQFLERHLSEATDKLHLQTEAFKHTEKIASAGSWTWNLDTNEKIFSDNIYSIYGLKAQSVSPDFLNFGKFIHPDDRERINELNDKIQTLQEPVSIEYRIIRSDGQVRYLRSRNQPATNEYGQTIRIGTMQDITEEVLVQQQLMDRIRFAEVLQETMPDRIIVTDSANNIISWNKSCENVYKLKKENVIGKNFFEVQPESKVPEVLDRFKRALEGEVIHMPVVSIPQAPGIFELLMVPFRNEAGSVVGVLHVLHDITQQQYLQHQLGARLEFIEKLQEASIDRIIVLDTDLYFQLWNHQCEKHYNLTKEEVIGRHILEIFPKLKSDPLYKYCIRAIAGETVYAPAHDKGEITGYQESYFIPLKNDRNEVTGILWIMHNLKERFVAAERLSTSEQHLKTAQKIAMMGSYEMNIPVDGVLWSDETYRIFDYPRGEEITPEKIDARIHPDDVENVRSQLLLLESGAENEAESTFRIYDSLGQLKFVSSRSQLIKDNAGNPLKIVGAVQDITAKKLAEQDLLKHRELLQQAEAIGHVGSWELDIVTSKLSWSHEIFRMYGYAPDAFEPSLQFYFATIQAEHRMQVKKTLLQTTDKIPFSIVYTIVTLDGELRHIQLRGRSIQDDFGKTIRVIGTTQDISEHKLLEEELRQRNERLRLQYELDRQSEKLKKIGAWQWDISANHLIWAENLFFMFGQNPFLLEPTIDLFIQLVHPDDRNTVNENLQLAKRTLPGSLKDFEFRANVNDDIRYFRFSGRTVANRNGKFVIGTIMDITQDALMREELAQKINYVEALNNELTALTFVASHDLREPLRKIQLFSDWLTEKEEGNLSEEGKDRFGRIKAAVARMQELIDDILDFSRINSAEKKLVPVDLNKVLKVVLNDLNETIKDTGATIDTSELPLIKGNASQCEQLFGNLLSNALKYVSPGKKPHIVIKNSIVLSEDISQASVPKGRKYHKIVVTDNGIGFDEQYSKKIFQMFQRLHGKQEYPGTGMGLAICKKVMDYHEGFIFAHATQGEGAMFECYFPHTNVSI